MLGCWKGWHGRNVEVVSLVGIRELLSGREIIRINWRVPLPYITQPWVLDHALKSQANVNETFI